MPAAQVPREIRVTCSKSPFKCQKESDEMIMMIVRQLHDNYNTDSHDNVTMFIIALPSNRPQTTQNGRTRAAAYDIH